MHTWTVILCLAGAGLAAANPQPNPNPEPQITLTAPPQAAQSAAIESALQNLEFNIGLFDMDELNSATKALAAAPAALQSEVAAALPQNANGNFPAFISAVNEIITGTPTGFNSLPTDVQGFVKSVGSAAASIVNNGGDPAPAATTGAAARKHIEFAAGMLGVGVLGAAML